MGFYDDINKVKQYMSMAEGYDGRALIEVLKEHLHEGASVLELGMGPGKDLAILKECYSATGSDYSQVFIDLYKEKNPNADVVQLDAVSLPIERTFDGIYSNKVLQHLALDDLKTSIQRQALVLNEKGIIFHSFWYGDGEEDYDGLRFIYYTEESLKALFKDHFEIIYVSRYTEEEENDSVYIIGRNR